MCEIRHLLRRNLANEINRFIRGRIAQGLRGQPVLTIGYQEKTCQIIMLVFNLHVENITCKMIACNLSDGNQIKLFGFNDFALYRTLFMPNYQILVRRTTHNTPLDHAHFWNSCIINGRKISALQSQPRNPVTQFPRYCCRADLSILEAMSVSLHISIQEGFYNVARRIEKHHWYTLGS